MANATTQFYVSGPAYCWAGVGAVQAWEFVGYSRNGLQVQIVPSYEDVEVDYGGRMPGDVQFLGEEARVSGVFSRYNESVIKLLLSWVWNTPQGGGDDAYPPGPKVGTLMNAEGGAYPLLIYSPYQFKSQYGTMVPGFWFYSSYLSDPFDENRSIRAKMPSLAWRAIPVFGAGTGNNFVAGLPPFDSYRLYTTTMPGQMPATG